jgi:hypothetical protein
LPSFSITAATTEICFIWIKVGFSFVLIQKKQKIKARDCFLVRKRFTSYNSTPTEPFHPLLSRCFVGDFSTTSKKTLLSSALKPKHPSAEIKFFTSTLSARFCQRIEGCGNKVEGKILAFLLS